MAAEELEADFAHYYPNRNFLDIYRPGGMTLRQAAVLAKHLPPGAMTWRKLGGPNAWPDDLHMLAKIDQSVRVVAWMNTEDAQNKINYPKLEEPPTPLHERVAKEERAARRARKYAERQEHRRRRREE